MLKFWDRKKLYFSLGFCLNLFLLTSLGCQQGKKEDGQSQSYNEVLVKCDSLEESLAKEKINLKETPVPPTEMKDFDFSMKLNPQENKVQSLLEQYIITSQKLIEAGDTKVVLFPEKDRIQQSLNNAVILLGYLYAKSTENGITHAVQDKNLDYSEFSYRFARYNYYLRILKIMDVPLEDNEKILESLKNLKSEQLVQLIIMSDVIAQDLPRIRTLSERNKNWTLGIGITYSTSEEMIVSMSKMSWNYSKQAKEILTSREKKIEKPEQSVL